jgi:hypothetical protein
MNREDRGRCCLPNVRCARNSRPGRSPAPDKITHDTIHHTRRRRRPARGPRAGGRSADGVWLARVCVNKRFSFNKLVGTMRLPCRHSRHVVGRGRRAKAAPAGCRLTIFQAVGRGAPEHAHHNECNLPPTFRRRRHLRCVVGGGSSMRPTSGANHFRHFNCATGEGGSSGTRRTRTTIPPCCHPNAP